MMYDYLFNAIFLVFNTSNIVNDFFGKFITGICESILRVKPTKTLPFDCHCNYTHEYVEDLLWYKEYYEDLNVVFITMYIVTIASAFYVFSVSINIHEDTKGHKDTYNLKERVNTILKDLDTLSPPQTEFEFENIELKSSKKRKLIFDEETEVIKL